MKHIICSGTAYEIGLKHGTAAKEEVKRSVDFYESLFQQNVGYSWPEVRNVATKFLPFLERAFPGFVDEMKGVAQGAGVTFETILAMNARTEIAYGIVNDGCTALGVKTGENTFLGQNWDWKARQSPNVLTLHIQQPGKPTIHMVTEAGIIGKIGLNSCGVGVTLNAVGAKGISFDKIPCHLALRAVLECPSREAAAKLLREHGVASACHITVADAANGALGFECTSFDMVEIPAESNGFCAHSNHMVKTHMIEGIMLVPDSTFRLRRIQELARDVKGFTLDKFADIFKDEENYPGAINRCFSQADPTGSETLFSVVMDLNNKFGRVKEGRPTGDGEVFELRP